ncbi:unnamed protein product [Musa acuminata var. zebrina]
MMDDGFPQLTHLQFPKPLVSRGFFMSCNHSLHATELGTKIFLLLFIVSLSIFLIPPMKLFYFQHSDENACKNHNQISVRSTMEHACSLK